MLIATVALMQVPSMIRSLDDPKHAIGQPQLASGNLCAFLYAHESTTMLDLDNSPKRAANLTLNAKALEMAKALGMNVSQTLDALLKAEVERRYREKWLKENQRSIATYNERVARDGVFGDDLRDF